MDEIQTGIGRTGFGLDVIMKMFHQILFVPLKCWRRRPIGNDCTQKYFISEVNMAAHLEVI